MSDIIVRWAKTHPGAKEPFRGSSGAIGYDLYAVEAHGLEPGDRELVSTGISIEIPPGMYGRIAPRSGWAVKFGVDVGAGVIDPDYRGTIKVLLFNLGKDMFVVQKGDRIAQLIFEKADTPVFAECSSLDGTERGEGGFGSTNTK